MRFFPIDVRTSHIAVERRTIGVTRNSIGIGLPDVFLDSAPIDIYGLQCFTYAHTLFIYLLAGFES
jgi:hypothetical protein